MAAGGAAFDPEVVRQLLAAGTHADPLSRLTPRERDVLDAMAEGLTNAEYLARMPDSDDWVAAVRAHAEAGGAALRIEEVLADKEADRK